MTISSLVHVSSLVLSFSSYFKIIQESCIHKNIFIATQLNPNNFIRAYKGNYTNSITLKSNFTSQLAKLRPTDLTNILEQYFLF